MIWLLIRLLIELRKLKKNSQRNNFETVTNENDKEISKQRCISPDRKTKSYWWADFKIV